MLGLPLLAVAAITQGDFRPNAANRWITDGLRVAVREGVAPRYLEGMFRTDILNFRSRYEVAVTLYTAVSTQTERSRQALKDGTDVERASMIRAGSLVPFYRRATNEFRHELTQLGLPNEIGLDTLETLAARLDRESGSKAHPFRDVPADHWAAKAVGDLRALGLLDGYPDERFRG